MRDRPIGTNRLQALHRGVLGACATWPMPDVPIGRWGTCQLADARLGGGRGADNRPHGQLDSGGGGASIPAGMATSAPAQHAAPWPLARRLAAGLGPPGGDAMTRRALDGVGL